MYQGKVPSGDHIHNDAPFFGGKILMIMDKQSCGFNFEKLLSAVAAETMSVKTAVEQSHYLALFLELAIDKSISVI